MMKEARCLAPNALRPANNGRTAQPVSAPEAARRGLACPLQRCTSQAHRRKLWILALKRWGAHPSSEGYRGYVPAGATFIALRPATPANPIDQILCAFQAPSPTTTLACPWHQREGENSKSPGTPTTGTPSVEPRPSCQVVAIGRVQLSAGCFGRGRPPVLCSPGGWEVGRLGLQTWPVLERTGL